MTVAYTSPIDTNDVPSPISANVVMGAQFQYTLAGALTLNQVIPGVPVPKGARVVGMGLSATDLDTNGTPTIVLAVGDGGDDDRFITASTIGQAGGVQNINAHTGYYYQYTSADTIDIKVTTAPATGATTGTIRLHVLYVID